MRCRVVCFCSSVRDPANHGDLFFEKRDPGSHVEASWVRGQVNHASTSVQENSLESHVVFYDLCQHLSYTNRHALQSK